MARESCVLFSTRGGVALSGNVLGKGLKGGVGRALVAFWGVARRRAFTSVAQPLP